MDEIRKHYLAQLVRINSGGKPVPFSSNSATNVKVCSFQNRKYAHTIPWYKGLEGVYTAGHDLGFLKNIIVHGSFGDGSYCDYSDLDLTLVLDQDGWTEEKSKAFSRWNKKVIFPFLVQVDPLQHHGAFLIWDDLVQNYSESILPFDSYHEKRSWSFVSQEILFRYTPVIPGGDLSLNCCRAVANSKNTFFKYGYSPYQVKRFLSNLMLIPAFYFSDLGNPVFKADSFEPFYREFGTLSSPILRASELRQEWKGASTLNRFAAHLTCRNYTSFRIAQNIFNSKLVEEVKTISTQAQHLLEALECRLNS